MNENLRELLAIDLPNEPECHTLIFRGLELALTHFKQYEFCTMFGVGLSRSGHVVYFGSPLLGPPGVISIRSWIEKEVKEPSNQIAMHIIVSEIQIAREPGLQIDLYQHNISRGKIYFNIKNPAKSQAILIPSGN